MTTTETAKHTTKEPPHKRFQIAYDNYFRELGAVHEDTRRRFQEILFEYQRSVNQANQSHDLKALYEAYDCFQREYKAAAEDTTPLKRYAEAYRDYKGEVKEAVAHVDLDDLDPLTLAATAQSFSVVACAAGQFASPPMEAAGAAEGETSV